MYDSLIDSTKRKKKSIHIFPRYCCSFYIENRSIVSHLDLSIFIREWLDAMQQRVRTRMSHLFLFPLPDQGSPRLVIDL